MEYLQQVQDIPAAAVAGLNRPSSTGTVNWRNISFAWSRIAIVETLQRSARIKEAMDDLFDGPRDRSVQGDDGTYQAGKISRRAQSCRPMPWRFCNNSSSGFRRPRLTGSSGLYNAGGHFRGNDLSRVHLDARVRYTLAGASQSRRGGALQANGVLEEEPAAPTPNPAQDPAGWLATPDLVGCRCRRNDRSRLVFCNQRDSPRRRRQTRK